MDDKKFRSEAEIDIVETLDKEKWTKSSVQLIEEFFDSLTIQDDPYTAIAKDNITIIVWQEQYAQSDFEIIRDVDSTGKEVLSAIIMPAFFIVSDNIDYTVSYIELEEDIPTKHTAIVHVPNSKIKLYIPDNYETKKVGESKLYILHYKPEDYVFTVEPVVLTAAVTVSSINKLYAYRKLDYPHRLLYILLDLIGDIAPVDLVHYELFVSELVRCADNPKLPARLCPSDKFIVLSQKKVPHIESPIRAIVFERYSEAITKILLNETKQNLSTLDRLLIQDYENLDKER